MRKKKRNQDLILPPALELTDADVSQAMKRIPGYLDITPADFRELYAGAFRHALERLTHSIRAKDIMTFPVISCRVDTPLFEVAARMASHEITGLPVTETDGSVLGVVSEKDFFARMRPESGSFIGLVAQCLRQTSCLALPIRGKVAGDIMGRPAVTVTEDAPLAGILEWMEQKKINRLPVLDTEGHLTGIVTRGDILSSFKTLNKS